MVCERARLNAATYPAEIALLTTSLSRLIDAEGRARGRRQRQKARSERAIEKQQPDLNLDGAGRSRRHLLPWGD